MNIHIHPYQKLKSYIEQQITTGALKEGDRIPSENELTEIFGVSRMTANRALRELAIENQVVRVAGLGSFVKVKPPRSSLVEIRDIALEIEARGQKHHAEVKLKEAVKTSKAQAADFETATPLDLFHVMLVHYADDIPVQLENRFVNAALVPQFLAQDFSKKTPTAYLLSTLPAEEIEHHVEAMMPDKKQQRLLKIDSNTPCLKLHRRSWHQGTVVTSTDFLYPANRYQLSSKYHTKLTSNLT